MNLDLTEKPLVVATVTQPSDLEFLQQAAKTAADVLEFRLDDLNSLRSETMEAMEAAPCPTLLTVRRPDEGGANDLSDEERLSLYRDTLGSTDLVDTEIASLSSPTFSDFVSLARHSGTPVIASFHDFDCFPGIDFLRNKTASAFGFGADVAKLAVFIDQLSDLYSLAELVEQTRAEGHLISAMGMGPLGKLSRLVLAKAGSCLNYGYLQTPNAPGQWSAEELRRLMDEVEA